MNPGWWLAVTVLGLGAYAAMCAAYAHRDLARLAARRAHVHHTDRGGAM